MAIGLSPEDVTEALVEHQKQPQNLAYRTPCTKCADYQSALEKQRQTIKELQQRPTKVYDLNNDSTTALLGLTLCSSALILLAWVLWGFQPVVLRALVVAALMWGFVWKIVHEDNKTRKLYPKSETR